MKKTEYLFTPYLGMHWPPLHLQSPLHHERPFPLGHWAQVGLLWLPQLTICPPEPAEDKIIRKLEFIAILDPSVMTSVEMSE